MEPRCPGVGGGTSFGFHTRFQVAAREAQPPPTPSALRLQRAVADINGQWLHTVGGLGAATQECRGLAQVLNLPDGPASWDPGW